MKNNSILTRITALTLALGIAGVTAAFAQTSPTPAPAASTAANSHTSVLTPEEKAQLKKAHDEALAANPDLKTEGDSLKTQHDALKAQGANASQADMDALKAQHKDYEQKMHAAMLAADPTLAPVFAKLEAAHKAKSGQ